MLFYKNVIFLFLNLIYRVHSLDNEYNTGRIPSSVHRRQDTIPIIYVKGSHYEVGFMIGQTYGKVIQSFVESYRSLKDYLPIYNTEEGKKIYQETLEITETYFPQYLVELKGMADGSNVSFHKLFLIQMDDIILISNKQSTSTDVAGTGCSTLMVNNLCGQFIGHTEDALSETINHFYIVSAHIQPSAEEMGGMFEAREEKWEAVTYAGSLPGYASGYNHHGVVTAINTIFAKTLQRGKIPRGFLTRALLASKADINEIQQILTNNGAGTADAFHVNVGFLDQNIWKQKFYSIEVTPSSKNEKSSDVIVKTLNTGSTLFHTNKLKYSTCEELNESGWKSSVAREQRFADLTIRNPVKNTNDILNILGDTQEGEWQIFRDREDDFVNTINLGLFDFTKKTWTFWTNNPKTNSPIIQLPLEFTTFISPTEDDKLKKTPHLFNIISKVSDICKRSIRALENYFS